MSKILRMPRVQEMELPKCVEYYMQQGCRTKKEVLSAVKNYFHKKQSRALSPDEISRVRQTFERINGIMPKRLQARISPAEQAAMAEVDSIHSAREAASIKAKR